MLRLSFNQSECMYTENFNSKIECIAIAATNSTLLILFDKSIAPKLLIEAIVILRIILEHFEINIIAKYYYTYADAVYLVSRRNVHQLK